VDYIKGSPSRPGPEAELVRTFVHASLPPASPGEIRCVLIEPHVETWRPDIIVAYWKPSATASWPAERQNLTKLDLRLAQLLYLNGPMWEEEVQQFFPQNPQGLLKRLDIAGLVGHDNGLWSLKEIKEILAVRRILAFEAKISAVSKGLKQAHLNTWFASESYLLTASRQPMSKTIERAWKLGVGVFSQPNGFAPVRIVDARTQTIPVSFASWLINELVWKIRLEET